MFEVEMFVAVVADNKQAVLQVARGPETGERTRPPACLGLIRSYGARPCARAALRTRRQLGHGDPRTGEPSCDTHHVPQFDSLP